MIKLYKKGVGDKLSEILKKNRIEYDWTSTQVTKDLVNKIRESGYPGTYKELTILPIIENDNKAYPAYILNNEGRLKRVLDQLKKSQEQKPEWPKTPAIHDDPILNLNEDTTTKIQQTMEMITKSSTPVLAIESMFNKFTEDEKHAFLVGYRLAKHSDARLLQKQVWILDRLVHEMDRFVTEDK